MTREDSFYVKYAKRILDILISVLILICFCWLYLLCAAAIAIDSGLPVIYRQERCGKCGTVFTIYKFRTMVKNADKIGPTQTADSDLRITRTGKILRATSLDELPQVINVMKGDMSIIGFRPDVFRGNEDFSQAKYLMRPGITGYAQVNGRSSLSAEEREYWNDRYTQEVSFITDIKILVRTVVAVIKKAGVN